MQPQTLDPIQPIQPLDSDLPPLQEIAGDQLQTTIRLGERVFFVGHTGSGKTFLAGHMLERIVPRRVPVVVIDPKHDFYGTPGQGWEIVEDLPRNWESRTKRQRPMHMRLIIRPEFTQDFRKNARVNTIYRRIFERKGALVYLDDAQRLTAQHLSSAEMAMLVQMGRSRGVSVWASTLRPAGIPRYFLSESDHIFCFRLRDQEDRDRVASVIGPRGKEHPGPGPHDFFYRPPGVELIDPILVHQGE